MKVELISITPKAEQVIEKAGRVCYLSFDKKQAGSEKEFIKRLIRMGHTSVLEHAKATFLIKGASRSFTHQLVRHRLCSYSQQSQRYINERNFSYIIPEKIKRNQKAFKIFEEFIKKSKHTYVKLKQLGIPNEDARFVLPNAIESQIVVTANFRELRHIFILRGAKSAQWEIRMVAIEMLRIMKKKASSVFFDLEIDNNVIVQKF